MKNPMLSVIIPAFNEEENIANAPAPTVDEEDMPVEKADAHLDIPEE